MIFILIPGTILGVVALRVLRQEEQLIRQRTKEDLERTAKEIGRELESAFESWDVSVGLAVESEISSLDAFPEIIRQGLRESGEGVLISPTDGTLHSFPSDALLFQLDSPPVLQSPTRRPPAGFSWAESLEIKKKDYPKAILAYRNLLGSAQKEIRALLLQRLARTLHKAGRLDEAADTYRNLQAMDTVVLGGLPSDFLGRSQLCALAAERGEMTELGVLSLSLYRDLVRGKWLLDEPRYMYYSDRFRSWCRESQAQPGELARLQTMEEHKLALTRAAKEFSIEPGRIRNDRNGTYFCFWRSDPFAAVVLSEKYLRLRWWPQIVSSQGEDLESALYSSDGYVLFGSTAKEVPPFAVVQNLSVDGMTWRIQVWPRDPEVIQSEVRQRQYLFLAILVFVGTLLIFGSYMTVRTVRREMEISRLRAGFVSTVSHEFRSPLTGIRHLGEMLLDDRVKEKTKLHGYYKMIVKESDRLTRLVENILDFSRMEEGRKEFQFEPLDTSVWLRELAEGFQVEMAANGIGVEADIPEALLQISADKEALGSAVHNLLDNAVKYSPGEKTVWIFAEETGGEIKISVRDKGIGISDQDRKRIFDRFYRAGGEVSKRVKGAGLGLSLVRYIVEAHRGRIECESRPGDGSTFSIYIPAEQSTEGGVDE